MKRKFAVIMSAALAAGSTMPVMAESETAFTPSTYVGEFSLTADGESMIFSVTAEQFAEDGVSVSANVTLPASVTGEEADTVYGLNDVLRVVSGDLYINVAEIASTYGELLGSDISSMLPMFGIAQDWVEIPAMSIKREYTFDQVGDKDMYLLHHEEIESLAKTIPGVKRIRFFMTFGQSYLDHMRCLEDVGMLSTTPISFNGQEIVPIQFLKALLPDPASLGPRTKGKTNIGCIFTGTKDGKEKTYYIYNICDHQSCYQEVGSQAISYTTGVPAMCGALMMLTGKWEKPGVYTVEEFDPDPFLDALDQYGLPRSESHTPALVD